MCCLLTHVSQRVRIEAVRVLQRTVGMNCHHIMRCLSGVKPWHEREKQQKSKEQAKEDKGRGTQWSEYKWVPHLLCRGDHRCPPSPEISMWERHLSLGRSYPTSATHMWSTPGEGASQRCRTVDLHHRWRGRQWAEGAAGNGLDGPWWGRTRQTGYLPVAAAVAAAADGVSPPQRSESHADVWTSGQTSQLQRTKKWTYGNKQMLN